MATESKGLIKHRPSTWCEIKRLKILDRDGWRIDDKDFMAPITEEEFEKRLKACTCQKKASDTLSYDQEIDKAIKDTEHLLYNGKEEHFLRNILRNQTIIMRGLYKNN